MQQITLDFLMVVAGVAIFFGSLGFWLGQRLLPRNGDAAKLHGSLATLRDDVGKWRVEDRHAMRGEMHIYVSPTLDKVDDTAEALTQLRERVVTLEADNRRRKGN